MRENKTKNNGLHESALELMEASSRCLGKGSNESLSEAAERVVRERDEALADARVLRERIRYLQEDYDAAYQCGAATMRQIIGDAVYKELDEARGAGIDLNIYTMPIPEDR